MEKVTFKSRGTQQDALCLGLKYAHQFGIRDAYLTSHFDVNRHTLKHIADGIVPIRGYDKYLQAFVISLNDLRLKSRFTGDVVQENYLDKIMRDILLVSCGIATDDELENMLKSTKFHEERK